MSLGTARFVTIDSANDLALLGEGHHLLRRAHLIAFFLDLVVLEFRILQLGRQNPHVSVSYLYRKPFANRCSPCASKCARQASCSMANARRSSIGSRAWTRRRIVSYIRRGGCTLWSEFRQHSRTHSWSEMRRSVQRICEIHLSLPSCSWGHRSCKECNQAPYCLFRSCICHLVCICTNSQSSNIHMSS